MQNHLIEKKDAPMNVSDSMCMHYKSALSVSIIKKSKTCVAGKDSLITEFPGRPESDLGFWLRFRNKPNVEENEATILTKKNKRILAEND